MNTEPLNPDFETRVRESFTRQPLMQTLGVSLKEIKHGAVTFAMPHHDAVTQQHGFIHGGGISAILDSACGYSAFSVMAEEAEVLTVELKANFLAPALGEHYEFRGSVIKAGRTLIVTEGRAYAITDAEEKLVTIMTATMMVVTQRGDVNQRN